MGQLKLPEKDKNETKGVRIVMMTTHNYHSRILLERVVLDPHPFGEPRSGPGRVVIDP